MCHARPSSLVFFWGMLNTLRWWFTDCSVRRIKKTKACIDRSDSLIFQHKRRPRVIGFTYASSDVHFRSTESQTFYRSDADDSIKCRSELRHDRLSGWFLKSRGLSASVSFLSSATLPALLIAQFFARSLTLVPRSLLRNSTETLATQAT